MIKKCSRCQLEKSVAAFHKNKREKYGYASYCRVCKKISANEFYKNHTLTNRAYKWRQAGLSVTENDYLSRKNKQNSCCAICGIHETLSSFPLVLDHCHKTKRICGLLCKKCNMALGLFNDSISSLQQAAYYLSV